MVKENQDRDAIVRRDWDRVGEERSAYIAQACGNDAVEASGGETVEAHFQTDSQEEPARTANGTSSPEQCPEENGANHAEDREHRLPRIGPYKIIKQVGEGAAGTVFQAEATRTRATPGRPQSHQARSGLASNRRPF